MFKADCTFCEEAVSGLAHDWLFDILAVPVFNRTIWSDSDYVIVPSLGPLTPDHCLVVSRDHYPCLRDAPIMKQKSAVRLARRLAKSLSALSALPAMIFENGSGQADQQSANCVNHLHIHVLTASQQTLSDTADLSAIPILADPMESILPSIEKRCDYVVCEYVKGKTHLLTAPRADRQFIRKAFASASCRAEKWDWRSYPDFRLVKMITARLNSILLGEEC